MAKNDATIIIKKIKKGGHAHHGGAWKVAYADFVTAMMAFFLLLWLLNATEAEELAGLADYFAPTVGLIDNQGIGFRGGKGPLSEGIGADKLTNKGIIYGALPTGPIVDVREKIELVTDEASAEKVALIIGGAIQEKKEEDVRDSIQSSEIADAIEGYMNEVAEESQISESVDIVETPEGLEIQIKNTQGRSMFKNDTAELNQAVIDSLSKLSEVLGRLPNYIAISGHTSSVPVSGKNSDYSNWELSADRANAARKVLLKSGVQPEQIAKIEGKSDNNPIEKTNPASPVNDRISIVLLRDSIIAAHKKGAPEKVFVDTESEDAKELIEEEEEEEKGDVINEEIKETTEELDKKIKDEDVKPIESEDPFIKEDDGDSSTPNPLVDKMIKEEKVKRIEEKVNEDLFIEEKGIKLEEGGDIYPQAPVLPMDILLDAPQEEGGEEKDVAPNSDLFEIEEGGDSGNLDEEPGFFNFKNSPLDILNNKNKGKKPEKSKTPRAKNQELFDIEEGDEGEATPNPFDGNTVPADILKPSTKKPKKKTRTKAVNEDLFEIEDDEIIEEDNFDFENPFNNFFNNKEPSGNSLSP